MNIQSAMGVAPVSRGTRRWGTQVLPVCLPGVLAPTTWRSEVDRGRWALVVIET